MVSVIGRFENDFGHHGTADGAKALAKSGQQAFASGAQGKLDDRPSPRQRPGRKPSGRRQRRDGEIGCNSSASDRPCSG
jgi:hypothetical protein